MRRGLAAVVLMVSIVLLASGMVGNSAWAQSGSRVTYVKESMRVRPVDRIRGTVEDWDRVTLAGSVPPAAEKKYAEGEVAPGQKMERMVLVLAPDAAQELALQELIRAQQDLASSYYHRWLTPDEFGSRYGISAHDLAQLTQWLHEHGMEVEEVPISRRAIVFSGEVAQVESAFHTLIEKYEVRGETHYANATEVQIPRAFAGVVAGVVSLNDFGSAPQVTPAGPVYTGGGANFLSPMDWDTIYDVNPLLSQGIDGTGASIAVLGRVDVALQDVRTFRSEMDLPANDPQMIVNGADPGGAGSDDQVESSLDVEWAGAMARNATVKFVTSASGATDGIALSAQYAVTNNVASIISLSYGLCEAASGTAGNAFWNGLWSEAAAQGISVLVAAGDSGAAGCDSGGESTATQGQGVNALCSSPYSTCVGGTLLNDATNPGQYWAPSNGAGMNSALGYIPEVVWNESALTGGLWATGGGVSKVYAKPSWQAGPGVPSDGMRDVPDVSATAAIHDSYIIQVQGQMYVVGGTSAATPSMASLIAMVVQKRGGALGDVNPTLYGLANLQQTAGGTAVFHDITSGNNSVPGCAGYNAEAGYDEASGLGSLDASLLVNHWGDAAAANFALSSSASTIALVQGSSGALKITLTASAGFSSPVTLSASGMPDGVTVAFSAKTLTTATPVTATIAASSSATTGSVTITIAGTGGGLTRSTAIGLTVAVPDFSLATSVTSATVSTGGSATAKVTTVAGNEFKAAIALSVTGLPKGISAVFSPGTIASPGNGSSTLTLSAAPGAVAGTYNIVVTAKGGSATHTQTLSLTVMVPSFALALGANQMSVAAGGSATVAVSTAVVNGFKAAVALSVGGLPKGVTGTFSPTTIASPGSGSSTLTLKATSSAVVGTSVLSLTASGGGVTNTQVLTLVVTSH